MKKLIFPYGIRFLEDGKLDIFPAAEISIFGNKEKGIRAMFHLDSGATISILPFSDAEALNLKINKDTAVLVRGFSGESLSGYHGEIYIELQNFKTKIPVIFINSNVPRILGRSGIFTKFAIIFDEPTRRTGFLDTKKYRKEIEKFFS